MILIIKVSKEESMEIRKKVPAACIAITNRQSNHKKYYAEESRDVMRLLGKLRGPEKKNG